VIVRRAEPSEIGALARIWHDGWHDAHAVLMPEALVRVRTPENFEERMTAGIGTVWAIGARGAPLGFYVLNGDELDLLFVKAESRGKGVAAALIANAERRLRAGGTETAWLACVIGNARAVGFYEKSGWHRINSAVERSRSAAGEFDVNVWRYEKRLASP
jgi:GNAT superfamily N-acetyltransferase